MDHTTGSEPAVFVIVRAISINIQAKKKENKLLALAGGREGRCMFSGVGRTPEMES